MKTITIALKQDGTSELIHGPEVPFAEQRATVHGYRDSNVPEGVERVEIWSRNQVVKFAYRRPDPEPVVEAEPDQEEGTGEGSGQPTEPPVPPVPPVPQTLAAARRAAAAAKAAATPVAG